MVHDRVAHGPPLLGFEPVRWLGGALILLGAVILLDSFARFALQGRGTPAPIYPTATLVVSGAYRYVRNPMYLAVMALIAGQGLLIGSLPLLIYALAFGIVTHLFVLAYEEPTCAAPTVRSTRPMPPMCAAGCRD